SSNNHRDRLIVLINDSIRMAFRQYEGTIKPAPNFDPELAADELEKAMKGSGCDKNKVIDVIAKISNAQRQMIRTPYKAKYNKDLVEELKRELSGDFENVIIGLMETPTKYDAIQLQNATKGLGTRESTLVDILCSRTNNELSAIKTEYRNKYGRSLEEDVVGDTSGDFKELLVALLNSKRDTTFNVDVAKAREEARKIMGNKVRKEKPDKATMMQAFTTENFRQLARLFSEHQSISGETMQEEVDKMFSGDAKVAYTALIDSLSNKPRFFARQLYEAMKGLGTADEDLIRIIVARSEIDLADIRDEFERMYKKPLVDWIKSECSGAYRDALITIVNGN
uniref:Annexin n=1 Tax=Parascaris univalens TaxID=6257 RepID=A0A914ZP17_PARUN